MTTNSANLSVSVDQLDQPSSVWVGSTNRAKGGAIEFFTHGLVNRIQLYAPIAAVALGLWYGREWQHQLK